MARQFTKDYDRRVFIYTLTDPVTNMVRYVGRTYRPVLRLKEHVSLAYRTPNNPNKNKWIIELVDAGMLPILDIIKEVTELNWEKYEIFYIAAFRAMGADLLNMNNGGSQIFDRNGLKDSDITKERKIKTNGKSKKVLQLDKHGVIIKEWISARQAALFYNASRSHITSCCLGKDNRKSVCGFKWEYSKNKQ